MALVPADFVKTCPYCGVRSRFSLAGEFNGAREDGETRRWYPVVCPACGGGALFETDAANDHFLQMIPERIGDFAVRDLPTDVDADWREAVQVFDVGAHRMAVVACGRTLEAAADARGIEGRTLDSRIRKMIEGGLITAEFGEAVTYARFIRNTGAHAGQDVSPDAAQGTMRFTLQALRLLFEVPAELARLTAQPPPGDGEPGEGRE
jgi:hypothetical protein